jgi:stage II sporulation protein D
MQKASIGKILLALVISCVYIYLFGIVQVVHVSADNEREIEVSIPEATTSAETEKTPETTTIKLQDDKKPTLADVKAQTTATTKAETTTSTTTVKKRTPAPAADNTVIIPETTTAATTAAATTVATETTTAETTSAPTPTPDNSGEEQLSVYDQVTGTYYTAGAREIIARAVVGEIWNEFPDEAVKAQAVAEYTYIKKNNEMGVSPTTALKTDVYDRIYKLVDEVLCEAIYYNGEMIQSVFFASSCGYTNSAESVWGVDYPYLRSVDCPLDKTTDPNWGSTDSYSSDYIKNAVQNTLGIALTGDPSKWFKINSRLDNREHGWVTSISVGGMTKANGKTIDGRTIREKVLGYSLKSAAFDLKYDKSSDKFIFTTYGHGHGVGLSQYGAKALAENGYTYKQILQHYFTGVEIH